MFWAVQPERPRNLCAMNNENRQTRKKAKLHKKKRTTPLAEVKLFETPEYDP